MTLRTATMFSRSAPVISQAVRAATIFSHPAPRRFEPLQYFPTYPNIYKHRSTALVPLQYFPTTLRDASRRSNTFPLQYLAVRAAPIFFHPAPRRFARHKYFLSPPQRQTSLRPLRAGKIPPGVSYTVHSLNFTPASCQKLAFIFFNLFF